MPVLQSIRSTVVPYPRIDLHVLMQGGAMTKLAFASDYQEGCHPAILKRLIETNLEHSSGYGSDEYSESAREKIRAACACPEAEVYFLVGGTQANATIIGAMLNRWEGVLAPNTGHIAVHEAGAIEHGGHEVLMLPHTLGKISTEQVRGALKIFAEDGNHDHMVAPGMVYLSQPTEYGTLYSLEELKGISVAAHEYGARLFVDGARLAYALACPENDVTLEDLARLTDAFYIGGTKCGALLGEAVVFPRPGTVPHFFTIIKQEGALLAKGRVLGLQFDTLFTDGLYGQVGEVAIRTARRIRQALLGKGYDLALDSPTNQLFPILNPAQKERLERRVDMSFWENLSDGRTVMRIATSWATRDEDVEALIALL